MRMALLLAMLALFLTASTRPFAAGQAGGTPVPQVPATNGNITSPSVLLQTLPKDPFKNLFAGQVKPNPKVDPKVDPKSPSPQQLLEQAREQLRARLSVQMSKVKCGMTLIPADPKLDAAMRFVVPDGGNTFVIQVVPPSVCR